MEWKLLASPYERIEIVVDDFGDMYDESYFIRLLGSDDGYGNPMEKNISYDFFFDQFTVFGNHRASQFTIGDEKSAFEEIIKDWKL